MWKVQAMRGVVRHARAPPAARRQGQGGERQAPDGVALEQLGRRVGLDLDADIEHRLLGEEVDVLHLPDQQIVREMRMDDEPQARSDERIEDEGRHEAPGRPGPFDAPRHRQHEQGLEGGVAQGEEEGHHSEEAVAAAARQGGGGEKQGDSQELGAQAHRPAEEIGRAQVDEERQGETPAARRLPAQDRQDGGEEGVPESQGNPPTQRRIGAGGERRRRQVEEEFLVAEAVVEQRQAGPGQLFDDAGPGVGAGDRQVVVGVGVVERRKGQEEGREDRQGHGEDRRRGGPAREPAPHRTPRSRGRCSSSQRSVAW